MNWISKEINLFYDLFEVEIKEKAAKITLQGVIFAAFLHIFWLIGVVTGLPPERKVLFPYNH